MAAFPQARQLLLVPSEPSWTSTLISVSYGYCDAA